MVTVPLNPRSLEQVSTSLGSEASEQSRFSHDGSDVTGITRPLSGAAWSWA